MTGVQTCALPILLKDSRGLYLGEPGYDLDAGLPGVKGYGGGTLFGEVSHATTAVYWEDPSLAPVRLVATRFFNRHVVTLKISNL